MYTFKVNMDEKEYDAYVKSCSLVSIMQERSWAHVKSNWKNVLVGLYKDDVLVACASLLIRNLALNIKLVYVPRGYLIDYTNEELVKEFTKEIKAYAKGIKAYCVKIDPFYCVNETPVKEDMAMPINFKIDYDVKHNNLLKNGYIHKGFKKELSAYIQPRYNMAVPLIDKDNSILTIEQLRSNMGKSTKNYVLNYHDKRGVYFTYSSDVKDLDIFYNIIHLTEERQHITLRNKDYFKKILESYGDKALLCFAHINIDKYITFLESEQNDKTDEIEQAKVLKEKYGCDIINSVSLIVMPSNEYGLRVMEYLYAGNDIDILPNLKTNVGLLFDIFKYGIENNIHYCDLGGVEGTLDDNLYMFKSRFNPMILEFVGEYDLPIKKGIYKMVDGLIPYAKRTYKKIRNLVGKVK